jgi:hypothetical protein
MKTYIIRAGFTFLMPDNTVKAGGEKIQLEDDLASQHLHKLEEEPEAKPKKAATKPAASAEQPQADSTAPAADPVVDPAAGAADPS